MKTKILSTLKILCIVVIVFGATAALATYNEPTSTAQNAFKPLTVSSENQIMDSSFYSKQFLKAGNSIATPSAYTDANPTWNNQGTYIAEKSIVSPRAMINRYLFLPTKDSQVKVGSTTTSSSLPPAQPFTGDMTTPLIIDMNGRGSGVNDRSGREAMEFSSNSIGTSVLVNTPAIQFSSTKNISNGNDNRKADIIAGSLILSDNAVPAGSVRVLVSTDTNGNAVWGSMRVVTNSDGSKRIQVDYPGSPVATGQNLCGVVTPPPADLCPNISGTQTTVPAGMIVDGSGNCVTPPPVDLCTNITGTQTTVPAGMIKDTPGNTPGVCAVPPTDMCPNITGVQTTVPAGMIVDGTGNCVTPPVDLCTNIAGNQATVPAGMVKDTPGTTPGNCTIPPVDLCPNIAGVQTTIPYGKELKSDGNCGEVCRFGVGVQYSTAMNGEVSAASLNESALLQSSYADSLGTYCTYSHPGCTGNGCGFALSVNKPAGYTCSVTSVYAGNIGGETTCVNNSNSQTKTYICPVEVPLTSKQGVYGYDDVVIPFTGTPKRPISIENGKIVCSIKDRTFEFTHFKPF
jgi:hypothetical protein